MLELPRFDYDSAAIKINMLMQNEKALAEIREKSTDIVPDKVKEVYGEVCFPGGYEDRPYTFGSIVLSSDGRMAYPDDPQGPVIAKTNMLNPGCGAVDFWVLNMLRTYSDAIFMGARTLQTEPEATSHIFCRELAEARVKVLGKPETPLHLVLSFDGTDVPLEHKVFCSAGITSIICTSPEGGNFLPTALGNRPYKSFGPYRSADDAKPQEIKKSLEENPDHIHLLITGTGDQPDTKTLLAILRRMGLERVMVESPSYMWHLFQNKALDEIFISYSMVFAGGGIGLGVTQPFTSEHHPHSELLMLGAYENNMIFTRQRLNYDFM